MLWEGTQVSTMVDKGCIFQKENQTIRNIESQGRLDRERELGRLLNILNDILYSYLSVDTDTVEYVYRELKIEMEKEYRKTEVTELESNEMKVWHSSIFSCLELFRELLESCDYESETEIIEEFCDILNKEFYRYLKKLSQSEGTDNIHEKISRVEEKEYQDGQRIVLLTQKNPRSFENWGYSTKQEGNEETFHDPIFEEYRQLRQSKSDPFSKV